MSTSIGSLFASLTLQSDQFTAGLRSAVSETKTAETAIVTSFEAISSAASLMSKAIVAGIASFGAMEFLEVGKSALEFAANIKVAAEQTGLTVTQYQILRREALQTGVSMDSLDAGMRRLGKSLGDAQRGNETLRTTFQQLGIDVTQVNSTGDLLQAGLLEKLGEIPGKATAVSVGAQLMGRNFAALSPLVQELAKNSDEMGKKAEAAGLITDAEANKAHDASVKIAELADAFKTKLAIAIVDNIAPLTTLLNLLAEFPNELSEDAHDLSNFISFLEKAAVAADDFVSKLILIANLSGNPANPVAFAQYNHDHAASVAAFNSLDYSQRVTDAHFNHQDIAPRPGHEMEDAAAAFTDYYGNVMPSSNAGLGGGGGGFAYQHKGHKAKTPKDPDKKAENEVSDLQLEIDNLDRANEQQDIYNNLKKAGVTATSDFGKQIVSLTEQLDQGKALKEYNTWLDDFIKTTERANHQIGMTPQQKQIDNYNNAFKDQWLKLHPASQSADGSWTVNGLSDATMKADPDYQRGLAPILSGQSDQSAQDRINAGMKLYNDDLKEAAAASKKLWEDSQKAAEAFGKALGTVITSGFDELINGQATFGKAFTDTLHNLGELFLQELVYKPIQEFFAQWAKTHLISLLGGLGIGGDGSTSTFLGPSEISEIPGTGTTIPGAAFGPTGLAGGGSLDAGSPAWVGEQGPEMFVPNTSGTIVSNDNFSGGGNVFNIDARNSTNPAETQRMIVEGISMAMPAILSASYNNTLTQLSRPRM